MEASRILTADMLDILFEHMNKDYGAYKLRKDYNKRLKLALLITTVLAIFSVGGMWIGKAWAAYRDSHRLHMDEVNLSAIADKAPKPPVFIPPPRTVQPPRIHIEQFTAIKLVDQPHQDKQVHDMDDLSDAAIGKINQAGMAGPDVVNPPKSDNGSKVVASPQEDERTFTKVEVDAQFPGGDAAWIAYVTKAMNTHIDELQEEGKSGTVELQFIVDKDGVVSDVEALTMQGTKLAEIAVNALRRGPHWKPAQQNGRFVKAYRKQKVTFQMQEDQ